MNESGKAAMKFQKPQKNPRKQRNQCHQNPQALVLAGGGIFFSLECAFWDVYDQLKNMLKPAF